MVNSNNDSKNNNNNNSDRRVGLLFLFLCLVFVFLCFVFLGLAVGAYFFGLPVWVPLGQDLPSLASSLFGGGGVLFGYVLDSLVCGVNGVVCLFCYRWRRGGRVKQAVDGLQVTVTVVFN